MSQGDFHCPLFSFIMSTYTKEIPNLCQHYTTKTYFFQSLMKYAKRSPILMKRSKSKSQTIVFRSYASNEKSSNYRCNFHVWCKYTKHKNEYTDHGFRSVGHDFKRNPPTQELLMELLILIGGGYALYTVGMAIATELDYRAVNRRRK